MPQPTTPTGQTSAANPGVMMPGESSSQAYGRSRTSSGQGQQDTASGGPSQVMDHAKETISNVASQAGGKVTEQLDTQRDRAASSLGTVAHALRQTSEDIRDQSEAGLPVHQYVATAADQIEKFSGYLRSTNVRQMVGDVEQFARRQPGLFLGGAFLLGLIGARFLKSTSENTYTARRALTGPQDFAGGLDEYSDRQPYDNSLQTGYGSQSTSVPPNPSGNVTGGI